MPAPLTLTVQATVDLADPAALERARALLDGLADALTAAGGQPTLSGPSPDPAQAPDSPAAPRVALTGEPLRELLHQLAVGALGSPLNPGERLMLKTIAEHAPAPLPYDDNRALLGSGAKFGNVSSGLARRFWNRGYELPYAPDPDNTGYAMTAETAQTVLAVLDHTSA